MLTIWLDSIFFSLNSGLSTINGDNAAVVDTAAKCNIVHYWLLHLNIITTSEMNISTVDNLHFSQWYAFFMYLYLYESFLDHEEYET